MMYDAETTGKSVGMAEKGVDEEKGMEDGHKRRQGETLLLKAKLNSSYVNP